ncbi:MAG: AAA domain-containing protein, partial [Deltaproteobacteria bacterium]|nr:AAA domain-containing protein [Deltaproteobacteria bacterium]
VDLFEQVAQQLALAVDNMLAYEQLESSKEKLVEEKTYLKKAIETLGEDHDIIYGSPAMGTLIEDIKNVSATDATVLLTGETGTGKSLVARTIHKLSTRKKDTFFALNCAAMVTTLIESELFGHEKGAFTGANDRKIGRFELADKSTLFLDEISELPLNTQAKLLHVLQEKTFERVGGSQTITTDARIIAATNQDLKQLISEKKFREDLFYRLNIYPMHVPALRERIDDIPLLMSFFVEISCERLRRKAPDFDKSAVDALLEYPWPGNIRELENFIERIVIMKSARRVTGSDIRSILHVSGEDDNRLLTLDEAEKLHIESVLLRTRGVVGGKNGAAELLGIKRPKLQYRMKRLGIEPAEFKYMAN